MRSVHTDIHAPLSRQRSDRLCESVPLNAHLPVLGFPTRCGLIGTNACGQNKLDVASDAEYVSQSSEVVNSSRLSGKKTIRHDSRRRDRSRKCHSGSLAGLVSQLKGAPVDSERLACFDITEDLNRFGGVDVLRRHEPSWLIGAYRNERQINLTTVLPYLLKDAAVALASITRKPDGTRWR